MGIFKYRKIICQCDTDDVIITQLLMVSNKLIIRRSASFLTANLGLKTIVFLSNMDKIKVS